MTSADPPRRVSDSTISLAELRQRLGDPHLTIVDVRALPAYNGWRSEGAARGGHGAAPAGRALLVHVNSGFPEESEENHIPGALYLDANRLENPRDWNRRTPEELEVALRSFGISADTTVILYGRDTEGHANEKWPGRRAGQIAACRTALILRYAGVDDIRLLDGGYD